MRKIRSIDDIRALEAEGYDRFCPHPAPQKILADAAARWPDATALHYLTDVDDPAADRRWTYAELYRDVLAAARLFRALGVGPGRSVAIIANHTPMAQIALWGAQLAGRAAPMNPLLRPGHLAALLTASNAAAAVVMGVNGELDYWTDLVPALREEGVTLPILDTDAEAACPGSAGRFEDLLAAERGRPPGFEIAGGDDAIAGLYHTGGTTGAPKLVQHSRRNEAHVARSCAVLHGYGPSDVVVNGFPLFHVAGSFVYGLSTLSEGGTVLIPGRLGMRNAAFMGRFWQQAERHGVTVIAAVPTILSGLLGKPVDADISRIRGALTGGAPLPTELATAFEARTGVPVRNIFGMTETSGSIALESVHAPRTPQCCGFPLPFTEAVVVAHTSAPGTEPDHMPDPAHPLPPGESGLVVVRGPNVSPGYTDPALDAGTFLPGGWLVTGDLGSLDAEGRLYLSGRAKDVILRGSHNIDPQAIEDALMAHPDVESAAAVGMPDSYAGELPVAFVALRAGASTDAAALLAFLRDRIEEPAAMPKRVEIIDAMPVTPVGKIFKPALRRKAVHWAIAAAAAAAGLPEGGYSVEVGDALDVTLRTAPAHAPALRAAVMGMPIAIAVHSTGEDGR